MSTFRVEMQIKELLKNLFALGVKLQSIPQLFTPFANCSTAANVAAKTVDVEEFNLSEGVQIVVRFINTNTANNPTLKVGDTPAKPIALAGAQPPIDLFEAGRIFTFIFVDDKWEVLSGAASVALSDQYK